MSSAICLPGEQWLYTGQLDDMVSRYPWPGLKRGVGDLDRWLFFNLVLGRRPLINDGYLILNADCLKALKSPTSQLNALLRQGYARILSRNPEKSFVEVVKTGAREGIETYKAVTRDAKVWQKLQAVLTEIDTDLSQSPAHVPWPNLNVSHVYGRLVEEMTGLTVEQVGIDLAQAQWQTFVQRFAESSTTAPGPARSQWETLANELHPKKKTVAALMHLGNEIYHYSFGVGLAARPPTELGAAEVAVHTRWSPALSSLGESAAPREYSSIEELQIHLRGGIPYENGTLSYELLNSASPVGAARADYLHQRQQIDAGGGNLKDAKEATARYQAKLDEFLGVNATSTTAIRVCNATLCATAVAVTAIPTVVAAGIPAAAFVGLMTYTGTDFVVPHVVRRWSLDQKAEKTWSLLRRKRKPIEQRIDDRQALTSLVLNRQVAQNLTRAIPAFS